ncbi:unnamed protein product [Closterium sp. NIES-54]
MGAGGRLVGLKRVLLVLGLCANLLSTKALSEAGMKMEMMGTKVFKATLDGCVLWDLRGGKDMHRSMWEIPVLPWNEAAARLAAEVVRGVHASHITIGGGGDGSDGGLLVHREGALPSVTPSTVQHWVPMEKWSGKKPLVDMLCVFGCMGLVHVPKEKRDKLQAAAVWAVHLGLARGSKGWLMWDPISNTVFTTRDAKFMEGLMFKEWSEREKSKVGTNDPLLIPIKFSSSSELTEVSHDLGGAEGEAADVEELREWYARRCGGAAGAAGAAGGAAGAGAAGGASRGARGAAGAGVAGAAGAGVAGAAGAVGAAGAAGGATGAGAAGPGAVGAVGAGAVATGGTGAGGTAGVVAGDLGAEGTGDVSTVSGGAVRPRPYYVPLLQQVLGLPPSPGPAPPLLSPPPVQSLWQLQPTSPLLGPSPYSGPTGGLAEHREPESRHVSPDSHPLSRESRSASRKFRFALPIRIVRTGHRVSRPRPPPIPGTHSMKLCPSTAPLRVPLPSPPASSLPDSPDPESDSAASPTITCFLAIAIIDPLFESTDAFALVAELVDFAAASRLDFANSLVAESASESVCPPSVTGECALGTDVLEDRHEEFECFAVAVPHLVSMLLTPNGDPDALDIPTPCSYAEAIEGPNSSQWQAAMDAEMASRKSTGTYVDEVPPPGVNIGFDFFQTFSPAPKMTTLPVMLHIAAQRDYELHLLDFITAFLQGSQHEEIWLRRPPGFTGSFPADDLVFATADTEALAHVKSELQKIHTCTDLAPPSDESVEPSGPYPELVGCLMYLMTCTRPDLAYPLSLLARYVAPGRHRKVHWDAAKRVLRYLWSTSGMGLVLGGRARFVLTGHADASWVDDLAMQRSSQGYTFSLGSGSVSWRSTRSSSVLSSSCEVEIYAGAMAAQELCWLTYLLTDLGEAPRSPPVLYVDNKAMLALCQDHRLEHRTKHIALRYFLARELQQRGQLCLAYVASQANTADVFTKVLQPCDHQRFCVVLGLVPTVPHLLTS